MCFKVLLFAKLAHKQNVLFCICDIYVSIYVIMGSIYFNVMYLGAFLSIDFYLCTNE